MWKCVNFHGFFTKYCCTNKHTLNVGIQFWQFCALFVKEGKKTNTQCECSGYLFHGLFKYNNKCIGRDAFFQKPRFGTEIIA